MDDLIDARERSLGRITLLLGVMVWLLLVFGTFGVALLVLAFGYLLYLFGQSALISHIKGNGVELTTEQFPDLHRHFEACCARLQISKPPQAYVLSGGGAFNAFATQFLGHSYVVLLSEVVDAMDTHPDGVRFYLGHELGHLRLKHLSGAFLRWPVLWLPLLGAAYSRARESSCDLHGLACSSSPENAARALAALATGSKRWAQLNLSAYRQQLQRIAGFWGSFHELTAGYPWISKRVARVQGQQAALPHRNPLAYLLALFVPYAGRLGAGFGALMLIYIIGVLAAVALPAYKGYTAKAKLAALVPASLPAREALARHYSTQQSVPDSLAVIGIAAQLAGGEALSLDSENMSLSISSTAGELVFVPKVDDKGQIRWHCIAGEGMQDAQLPGSCKDGAARP